MTKKTAIVNNIVKLCDIRFIHTHTYSDVVPIPHLGYIQAELL